MDALKSFRIALACLLSSGLLMTLALSGTAYAEETSEGGPSGGQVKAARTNFDVTDLTSRRRPATPVSYAVEKGLTSRAVGVHRAARSAWPQIKTYYGYRNDPSSDHYDGRALDLMVPDYKSSTGKALGKSVADWAVANQKSLGIHYVIWDQQIWNVQRARDGWRPMTDRGNDSANHKNHVHISVLE